MSRDLWITKREAVEIDRIKKSIVLTNNSWVCGPTNASMVLKSSGSSPLKVTSNVTLSTTEITLDFYFKAIPLNISTPWQVFKLIQAANYGITATLDNNYFTVSVVTSAGTYTAAIAARFHSWNRYTITVDTSQNKARIYVDGVLEGSISVTSGNFSTNSFNFYFGTTSTITVLNGFIQDIALYNEYKEAIEIETFDKHKGVDGTYSSGLSYYWKLRETQAATIGAIDLTGRAQPDSSGPIYSSDDYATIGYGGSFVLAEYDLSLSSSISFKFPNYIPDPSCNGMLVVRWIDDNGDLQRRRFWDMEGVDINPMPEVYKGERVSASFTLEWWNIDGEDTLDTGGDVTLYYSILTKPTTSVDRTSVEEEATENTNIAETYSITDSTLNFDQAQVIP